MKVVKYGGTSLASAERFRSVCDHIFQDKSARIIVCSAPGKRFSGDIKITDLLLRYAEAASDEEAELTAKTIFERFDEIIGDCDLPLSDFEDVKQELYPKENLTSAAERREYFMPVGEIFSAKLLAALLRRRGETAESIDAGEIGLQVMPEEGKNVVNPVSADLLRQHLTDGLKRADRLVIPGFYGKDQAGRRRTLSRGGSDVSAAWMAAALNLPCEIWTDVNGVYEANPAEIPGARFIPRLTYREMFAMAKYGAAVLHPDAVSPLEQAGCPLFILNSFEPSAPGTEIARFDELVRTSPVAVSYLKGPDIGCIAVTGEGFDHNPLFKQEMLRLCKLGDINAEPVDDPEKLPALVCSMANENLLPTQKFLWEKLILAD